MTRAVVVAGSLLLATLGGAVGVRAQDPGAGADTTSAGEGTVRPGASLTSQAQRNTCFRCHRVIDERRYSDPVREYVNDVHYAKGFGCIACHGGDSRALGPAAKDRAKGYIGTPARDEIPGLCARCHSDARFMKRYAPSMRIDQLSEYRTSVHGQRLFELGDPNVAVCTSCHTAHSIRPPSDPASSVHPTSVARTCGGCHADATYMAAYDIPTDQLDEYHASVHFQAMEDGDLSAPTCNDCHGNHGAAPPEVEWIGNTCGQCHSAQQQLFDSSPHPVAFLRLGRPGCAGCHGNHAIETTEDAMLASGERSLCADCHAAGEPEAEAAGRMHALIERLKRSREEADSLLAEAEAAGLEVSQAQFELEDATNAIVMARTSTHAATVDSVEARVEEGLQITARAMERAGGAFTDLRIRRIGLAVSSGIIVVLIVGIVMKIREYEGGTGPRAGTPPDRAEGSRGGANDG